ncbi:hypothetical protein [Sphingobacterium sp. SYP-B4668]|uniref:hypothetical protein n=1 Tax=Sphingobacterium sp. SYP-B4668 TaxID=2996035 RepID=UPI0022DD2106|nr:hypothetical protein [Sphingobacterium sp. SYP-B4668]
MDLTYDYIHELRNRQMALRAKIEASPIAGEIQFVYGEDYYQEEARSMGLRMIRDGLDLEGEQMILEFTREHYPTYVEEELKWISKMMRYLNAVTDTLIDNLLAEQYIALQGNIDLPNDNAIYYPIRELNEESILLFNLDILTLIDLTNPKETENLQGWVYYRSDKEISGRS